MGQTRRGKSQVIPVARMFWIGPKTVPLYYQSGEALKHELLIKYYLSKRLYLLA